MANALNRTEAMTPSPFTPAIVRRDAFGPRPAFRALVAEVDGRGIGRALVTAVAREAVRRGLTCLEWGVRDSNARAQGFYRRLGARVGHARIAALIGRRLAALAGRR